MNGVEELSGYLDVKVPSGARVRGLTPWKTWKRHWCKVRRCGKETGIEIQIGGSSSSNSLKIPITSVLHRTESRSRPYSFGVFSTVKQKSRREIVFLSGRSESESQKWMAFIRNLLWPSRKYISDTDFKVSIIDNAHSRTSGLIGAYGSLTVHEEGITLYDSCSLDIKFSAKWDQLEKFYIEDAENRDDENKICVVLTNSDFPAGNGELKLFCTKSTDLVQCLKNHGFPHSSLAPPRRHLKLSRRLSRSESDLLSPKSSPNLRSYLFQQIPEVFVRSSNKRNSKYRLSTASCESIASESSGKIAGGVLTAGLGLMFSTPGGSEVDIESLHEYQSLVSLQSEDDVIDELLPRIENWDPGVLHRRDSGISYASGIYEEIGDSSSVKEDSEKIYENPELLGSYEVMTPPPLPPRPSELQRDSSNSEGDCSLYSTPIGSFISSEAQWSSVSYIPSARKSEPRVRYYSESPVSMRKPCCSRNILQNKKRSFESDYLPMSPAGSTLSVPLITDEQNYMVMTRLNTS